MHIAKILIDESSNLILDYGIPDSLEIKIGNRVHVKIKNQKRVGTVIDITRLKASKFSQLKYIESIESNIELNENILKLANWISRYYISSFERVLSSFLPKYIRSKNDLRKEKHILLIKNPSIEEIEEIKKRAKNQFYILQKIKKRREFSPISKLGKNQLYQAAKALENKGYVKIVEKETKKKLKKFVQSKALKLNLEQKECLKVIEFSLEEKRKKPILLHGVTGSGKTEVYLQACEKVLKLGKNALILVPEISLTSQVIELFKSRFFEIQDKIGVMHSRIPKRERISNWNHLEKGKIRIIIGSRSAIFSPIKNLGIIIVDEEHDSSYKQESTPRYHARDTAIMRAHIENCTIVLGSATPSIESSYNAQKKKYLKLELTKRVYDYSPPLIRIIDMRMEKKQSELSDILIQKIKQTLKRKEQTILFINRRGYYSITQCLECKNFKECPRCSIPLVFHKKEICFKCHICEYKETLSQKIVCSICQSEKMIQKRKGTQKVEEILCKLFPRSKISRVDGDVLDIEKYLEKFRSKKIDVLIGTQIISKGLHFPNVTLVGVLNADISLNSLSDFRSGEKTYQILTQVGGRAGRSEKDSEVIIQTFLPHSPIIQFSRKQDYAGFLSEELFFRKKLSYPPFTHIASIRSSSKNKDLVNLFIKNIHRKISKNSQFAFTLPINCSLEKSHNHYHCQFSIRHKDATLLSKFIQDFFSKESIPKEINLTLDMDANSFL